MRSVLCRAEAIVMAVVVSACAAEAGSVDDPPPPATESTGCQPGERKVADRCIAAGIRDDGCAAGEHAAEGRCVQAGIPEDACGAGFAPSGDRGCVAILPARVCGKGAMAVPGEEACHDVAPCGGSAFPTVPTERGVEYVDGFYLVGDSDGSIDRPWATIQEGIDAAPPGSVVAVAAGSYAEDVAIVGKGVRIWGRCPALVEVVGSSATDAAIVIGAGADGTEIHDLAVSGAAEAIEAQSATDLLFEELWIHDTGWRGLYVRASDGEATAVLRGSLIEGAHRLGVWLKGATMSIDSSVVRDTQPSDDGQFGDGIFAEADSDSGARATLGVWGSLVEYNHKIGIFAAGSDLTVERTVVRDTLPGDDGFGRALQVQDKPAVNQRGSGTVRTSSFERSVGAGIFVANSNALIENTVVRDTRGDQPSAGIAVVDAPGSRVDSVVTLRACLVEGSSIIGIDNEAANLTVDATIVRNTSAPEDESYGAGIAAFDTPGTDERATLALTGSIVQGSGDIGVYVISSDAIVDGSIVSGTRTTKRSAAGLGAQIDPMAPEPPRVTVRASIVEDNATSGALVAGADVTFEGTIVRDGVPSDAGDIGRGVSLQRDASRGARTRATIVGCLFESNRESSVFVQSSDVTMVDSLVRDTTPADGGLFGVGVTVQGDEPIDRATVVIRSCVIERSHEMGVLVFDSDVTMEHVTVRDTQPSESTGYFGDGIAIVSQYGVASAHITDSHIERAARAAVANFGASISLGQSTLDCNPIDLNGERFSNYKFVFDDLGGNRCGCGSTEISCATNSASLEAPSPLSVSP
jgi:hypothetical protein